MSTATKIGKRGTIVIPANIRRHFGLEEGSVVIAEENENGMLIRPAVTIPVEIYSLERKAEFLLSNAVDIDDYKEALKEVKKMGLNLNKVPHHKPKPKKKS